MHTWPAESRAAAASGESLQKEAWLVRGLEDHVDLKLAY